VPVFAPAAHVHSPDREIGHVERRDRGPGQREGDAGVRRRRDPAVLNEVPSLTGAALRCRGLADEDAETLAAAVHAYQPGTRPLELAGVSPVPAPSTAIQIATNVVLEAMPVVAPQTAPAASSANPSVTANLAPAALASALAGSAPMTSPPIRGSSRSPEPRALAPWMAWKYCGMTNSTPIMASPATPPSAAGSLKPAGEQRRDQPAAAARLTSGQRGQRGVTTKGGFGG
jgi:hypothetical protein